MAKVVRLTESDLERIVKRVINEKNNLNELNAGDVVDAGLKVGEKLGLGSDWAYITQSIPGLNMVKPTYDIVKAFRTMQKQTFDENMESIREYMGGIKGVLISVALDTLAIGEALNPFFWALFLDYDCYLWKNQGKLNMLNIIMDIVGIITAGAGSAIGKELKALFGPEIKMGADAFIGSLASKSPKLFKYISSLIKNSGAIFQKASAAASKGIAVLSKKIPSMAKGLNAMKSAFSTMGGVLKQLESALSKRIGHGGVHAGKHVTKHYAQHKAGHEIAAKVTGQGHGGGHNTTHTAGHGNKTTTTKPKVAQNIKPKPKPIG